MASPLEKYMKKKAADKAVDSVGPNIPKKSGAKKLDADIPEEGEGLSKLKLDPKKKSMKTPEYLC